jgi:archaellum biogenesis ATPase FlaH
MSYCRIGNDSDVYVLGNGDGGIQCMCCRLLENWYDSFTCSTEQEMLEHLEQHKSVGHKVPRYAINRLRRETKQTRNGTTTEH